MKMKANSFAGALLVVLVVFAIQASARTPQNGSQKKSPEPVKTAGSGSAESKDPVPFPEVPRITAEEVQRMTKDKASVILVDTDDPIAYEAEHIRGAVNLAYDPTIDAQERQATLGALPSNKLVVFYCNCAHEEDSAPLVLEMWQLGYDRDKVKALKGGLTRWEQLGYALDGTEVNSAKNKGN
jgi:rhodanese-related sulfurtransferase